MKIWIVLTGIMLIGGTAIAESKTESLSGSRPNIIFILSDDSGWGEIGASGNPVIQTPNVDRLWREGTRFMNYHVAPSCAPTRAQLMTGNHEFYSGVTHTILKRNYLSQEVITLPQVLKSAGYATAMFGKWHLGLDEGYRPDQRGFDKAVTAAFDSQKSHWDPKLLDNGTQRQAKGYRTDVFFNEAMAWIENNKQKPFFCYLPMYNAHGPTIVGKEWAAPYENKGLFEPPTGRGYTAHDYYGMISNADHNMGRLLEFLEKQNLMENTLVIYSTDNGHAISGTTGAGHDSKTGRLLEGGLYNMGMRGGKGQTWRGSSCVPLILRWPGHIAPDIKVNRLAGGIDILPTLADLCGASFEHEVTGRSLVPLIDNPDAEVPDRMLIVTRSRWPAGEADDYKHRNYAIQTDRFRLVNGTGPQGPWKTVEEAELFDHHNDPAETIDRSSNYPEKKQDMQNFYDQWWETMRPRMVNEQAAIDFSNKAKKNKKQK
jgi:arylsulfatase